LRSEGSRRPVAASPAAKGGVAEYCRFQPHSTNDGPDMLAGCNQYQFIPRTIFSCNLLPLRANRKFTKSDTSA
jgi:hypothetical protein